MISVKKISGFILLCILLFSSLGISFYLHQCSCRGTNLYSIGTGLSEPKAFCCCSKNDSGSDECEIPEAIKGDNCCDDVVFFYLVPFAPDKIVSLIPLVPAKTFLSASAAILIETTKITEQEFYPLQHSPPGELTGKNLILFIQQIKIPFPAC
jgi:hypothetical protein